MEARYCQKHLKTSDLYLYIFISSLTAAAPTHVHVYIYFLNPETSGINGLPYIFKNVFI